MVLTYINFITYEASRETDVVVMDITSNPVGLKLSTNMHIYYAFGNLIYSL